jgi:hypothetical protein
MTQEQYNIVMEAITKLIQATLPFEKDVQPQLIAGTLLALARVLSSESKERMVAFSEHMIEWVKADYRKETRPDGTVLQ